ncbi:MAG TPA: efflux RND transporter periplasmic adaptor subunit, partial [Verrucomicrobiae bacterium]
MKLKTFVSILVVAAVAAAAGWFAARHWPKREAAAPIGKDRKVLFYQSAMHPWIKSDKPGKCTICGMDLVPVFEGEKGFAVAEGLVTLSSNSITVLHVQSVPARRAPLKRTLRVAGTIDDNDSRHRILSAYVDGRIDKLFVNYVGAEVREGQPLATFYSSMLLAAEREYAALKRQSASSDAQKLGPEQQALLGAAMQRLRQLGLNDGQITALASKPETEIHTELLAPMSGTVVMRSVYEGQYVKEGEKLFEIADFSTMWFMFDAYERDLTWLRPGQEIFVNSPAVPGKTFKVRVTFVDPNLNPMTRSARVRAEIPNPIIEENGVRQRELLHRVFAEATVNVELPETLLVPRSAVLSPGGQPVVYLDKGGGTYEQRPVKLGRVGDEDWEVLDGLSAGDPVVINGNLLIDAQAQLNQSAQGTRHDHSAPSAPVESKPAGAPMPKLTDEQRRAAQEFLAVINTLGAALAADKLEDFNRTSPKLHTLLPELAGALKGAAGWESFVGEVNKVGHFGPADDLKAARKSFAPLSMAAVEFAKRLRAEESAFASVKIFLCPMTEDAFPGAPKRGTWVQLAPPL